MKKCMFILIIFCISFSLYAFDRSLIGSWGLITAGKREEFVRFGQNDIIIMNQLFRERDFESGDNTVYINNFDGDSVIIQYYLLSNNSILFIMWNIDNPIESITLILSKL